MPIHRLTVTVLAGFVFWSDRGFYNVVGNNNGPQPMARPEIVTLA